MGMERIIPARLKRFLREEDGVALMEFVMVMPITVLLFGVVVEGTRMFYSYQAAISGVRDATRYLARVAPLDICTSGGSLADYTTDLEDIVRETIDGGSLFPVGITVTSVTPTLSCVTGTYRVSPAPVASVRADLTITFPMAGFFKVAGIARPTVTTRVTDEHRIFGS